MSQMKAKMEKRRKALGGSGKGGDDASPAGSPRQSLSLPGEDAADSTRTANKQKMNQVAPAPRLSKLSDTPSAGIKFWRQ